MCKALKSNPRLHLLMVLPVKTDLPRGIVVHASLELVRYLCPGCGRQHGIEVAERGAPPLEDVRLAEGT